ncbi:uncharacterized protein LOC134674744 [Cydia fagiglandana]|uniref:uncharacterized protein LOC134674744 n=1 Tax=Cydia fagiglandana TaxID=1458189 RepID=UPI002FEE1AB9
MIPQSELFLYVFRTIFPSEVEAVILSHEGVQEVCVTSVPHPVDHERPVAVVVRKPGAAVSAQEIKDLVTSEVSVQLLGGVLFVAELPATSTGKLARADVTQLARHAHTHAQLQ